MFKLLISLLISPVLFLLALDGIAAGICVWLVSRGFSGVESAVHTAKATAYFMIASGLTLSVICVAAGIPLMVLSFIFKSWRRALVCIGITLAAAALWRYFLLLPYFL
jgi:formate-dependent nitrite reductase membrane component NrfD